MMKTTDVIAISKEKGFVIFKNDNKNYNINIVGVRNSMDTNNRFSDELHVFWIYRGNPYSFAFDQFTTLPGNHYLKNVLNSNGTAILKEGQYFQTWKIGHHRGQYEALVQRLGNVEVWRDNNKNEIWEKKAGNVYNGMFGINIHRASKLDSTLVNRWSAGCQVFAKKNDFDLFMQICRNSRKNFGNSFTYTLLDLS